MRYPQAPTIWLLAGFFAAGVCAAARWRSIGPHQSDGVSLAESADGERLYATVEDHDSYDVYPNDILYVSENRGASWTDLGRSLPFGGVLEVLAHPARPDTLVLRTRGGVMWSDDRGATWRRLEAGLRGEVGSLVFSRAPPHALWAIASKRPERWVGNPRLYRLNEKRQRWKQVTGFYSRRLAAHPRDPDLLYLIGRRPGTRRTGTTDLFRSEDGGASWERAGFGLEGEHPRGLAFLSGDRHRLLAWTWGRDGGGDRFFVTEDGRSWSLASQLPESVRVGTVSVDPSDPSRILAGVSPQWISYREYGPSIARSRDGGRSWRLVGIRERTTVTCLLRARRDPDLVYATSRSGVFRGNGSGRRWKLLDAPQMNASRIESVAGAASGSAGPHWLYALGGDASAANLYRRRARDERWELVPIEGFTPHRLYVSPLDSRRLWAATWYGVATSRDAGVGWTHVELPDAGYGRLALDRRNVDRAWLVNWEVGLLATRDGGATWKPRSTPEGSYFNAIAIDPLNPGTIFLGGLDGVIKSSDGGSTWSTPSRFAFNVHRIVFDTRVGGLVFALASPSTHNGPAELFRSRDGGRSWERVRGNGLKDGVRGLSLVSDPDLRGHLYLGITHFTARQRYDGGVMRSTDSGETWELFNRGGLEGLHVLDLAISRGGRVHAATHARGVFSIRIPSPSRR